MPEENQQAAENVQETQQPVATKLKPLPFNITPATRERFSKHFQKSTDQALNALMDAFENQTAAPASTDAALISENTSLKEKIQSLEKQISDLSSQNNKPENTEKNQKEIRELKEKVSSLETALNKKDESIKEKDRMLRELDALTKNQPEDRTAEIEALTKEIEDLKNAADKADKNHKKEIENFKMSIEAKEGTIKKLQQNLDDLSRAEKQVGEDGYVQVQPIVAGILNAVAQKLTNMRVDGVVVTPSMIVADMTLKYNVLKLTRCFYDFCLSDSEIVEIAQSVNKHITSVRMLRKVLHIDEDLS